MKTAKYFLLISIILLIPVIFAGCWNYKEVDKMAIVAGVAIDKGLNERYRITVEIIQISGEKDTKPTSITITMEGKTIFDAVRNIISLAGKKLYWSHSKLVIISEAIAKDGITKVLDWYNRDAETRADANILISREATAKEILETNGNTGEIKSFEFSEMLDNERNLSKAPHIEIWRLTNELSSNGIEATIPTIRLKQTDGKILPQIIGTAFFKKGALIGFLSGDESMDMLFIKDEIMGGVLIDDYKDKDNITPVSLEIFNNKTKVKPVVIDGNLEINISTDTTVAIDEIEGDENLIEGDKRINLERRVESNLKTQIENLIKRMQSGYEADIFGFGSIVRGNNPKMWSTLSDNWKDVFKNLKINVKTKVHIRNSAMLSKPMKVGD